MEESEPMILVIDNYDSFTYNIVQYLGEMGQEIEVYRNDKITLEEIEARKPDHLLISPGPCDPEQAGISVAAIQHFAGKVPILGVCLGHQSIGYAFGGSIVRANRLMHGKTSPIQHNNEGVFAGMPPDFTATRYHSLLIERETIPDCLEITAQTAEGEIMGVRHKTLPIEGVQFHPESVLTEEGRRILANFVSRDTP
jgi:anthranilate synthase/aminodeoxychorismate synthase-like glutamine amidotransferase